MRPSTACPALAGDPLGLPVGTCTHTSLPSTRLAALAPQEIQGDSVQRVHQLVQVVPAVPGVPPALRVHRRELGGAADRTSQPVCLPLPPSAPHPPPSTPHKTPHFTQNTRTPHSTSPHTHTHTHTHTPPSPQVDYKRERLVFKVGIGGGAPTADMKALSGGERSLTSLAFILALGG